MSTTAYNVVLCATGIEGYTYKKEVRVVAGQFDIAIVAQDGRLTYEAVLFAASLRQSAPEFQGRLTMMELLVVLVLVAIHYAALRPALLPRPSSVMIDEFGNPRAFQMNVVANTNGIDDDLRKKSANYRPSLTRCRMARPP